MRWAAWFAAIVITAVALVRDAGPPRLTLEPAGFDELAGWKADDVAAAVPAFLKSCARFQSEADAAPFGPTQAGVDFAEFG
ncbi:MAG TPA: hypothetical protein VGR45_08495, partial [Stellaceae bacterium]|nr:hypothetical protein [Stellaceae bacterium]